jgi:hypothetical protein
MVISPVSDASRRLAKKPLDDLKLAQTCPLGGHVASGMRADLRACERCEPNALVRSEAEDVRYSGKRRAGKARVSAFKS